MFGSEFAGGAGCIGPVKLQVRPVTEAHFLFEQPNDLARLAWCDEFGPVFRMWASRFPFGIYYLETETETRVVAALDLRRNPSWIRKQVTGRQ